MKNYFRKIFYIFVFANLFFNISLAQSVDSVCPYTFSKDLQFGSTDHDVYVLQKILNSDKRTTIATDGVGSPGNESSYFGTGTREALKRFQALFIEYIGVADGKFSTRTRTVVQSLCSNDSVNSRQTTTPANAKPTNTPTPVIQNPLKISLSTNANYISAGSEVKIFVNTSKEIKSISSEIFIIDGGTVKEVRKLGKTQYMAIVTPADNSKVINIQIEADRVEDIDGVKNENASNEIMVRVTSNGITSAINNAVDSVQSSLGNILNQLTSTLPATQVCNGVQILATQSCTPNISPNSAPVSSTPATSPAQSPQQQPQQNPLSQMLSSMLGGMNKGQNQSQQDAYNEKGEGSGAQNYTPSSEPFTGGSVDLSSLNVPEFCKAPPNYGGKPSGKCFDVENTTPLVKETLALACAAINKQVPVVSASRSGRKCANGGVSQSQHLTGKAVDIGFLELSSTERQKVFEVFKKKGFNGYGCYGANSTNGVHLDHGPARRWGPDKTGSSWSASACPQELFLGGYAR